jgi:hypothetical protein
VFEQNSSTESVCGNCLYIVQVICADTSYSINTQWPETHLRSAGTVTDTAAQDVRSSEETRWMSYAAYAASAREQSGGALTLPGGIGAVPREAESRSPLVITELLFEFPESPLNASSCMSSSSARVHGSLSDGSTYACGLPALKQSDCDVAHDGGAGEAVAEPLIGAQVSGARKKISVLHHFRPLFSCLSTNCVVVFPCAADAGWLVRESDWGDHAVWADSMRHPACLERWL